MNISEEHDILQFPFIGCDAVVNIKSQVLPVPILKSFGFLPQTLLAITLCWYNTRCVKLFYVPLHCLHFSWLQGGFFGTVLP